MTGHFRQVEQRGSDALVKLYEQRFDEFNESDRKAADQLVVALMFNHLSWVAAKERIRWEVIDDKVALTALNAGLVGRNLDVPAAYGLLNALTSRNYLHELVRTGVRKCSLGCGSMRLMVHGPPSGQSFVIGDYPVVGLPSEGLGWALLNSSGVSEGIHHSVVQSGEEFSYIRVAG